MLTSEPARTPQVSKFLSVFDLATLIKLSINIVDCKRKYNNSRNEHANDDIIFWGKPKIFFVLHTMWTCKGDSVRTISSCKDVVCPDIGWETSEVIAAKSCTSARRGGGEGSLMMSILGVSVSSKVISELGSSLCTNIVPSCKERTSSSRVFSFTAAGSSCVSWRGAGPSCVGWRTLLYKT